MRLEFRYTGLDFRAPQQVRFRYRMENFDRGWMDAGTRRAAYYMNLPDGEYTFRVQARNRDGVWNEAGAKFAFEIAPHYYRTAWFYLLCVAVVGCVVLSAHLVRMAQVREAMETALQFRLEERARIARELHDTLLQGISGIAMQLRALMRRLPQGEARSQLGEILTRMEHSTKETRLALRDLRLPGEAGRDLRTALESFGQTMVADTEQRFRMEVAGEPVELPAEIGQNLLRIGQEAILNAARHSGAAEIHATVEFKASGLTLRIADNGRGFDAGGTADSSHWGVVGMRERAKRIGGEIEIASSPGGGACVTVNIPWPRR
jgi:signal transduction histidine kinase